MKLQAMTEGFPGQPEEMVAAVDPAFKMANEEHDENVKKAEEAMEENKEAVELVAGDNTKEKDGEVTSDTLKKMHLSEDLFTDVFKPVNESMINEDNIDYDEMLLINKIVDVLNTGFNTLPERAKEIIDIVRDWDLEETESPFEESLNEEVDKNIHDLAVQLMDWARDYDYYDYMDYSTSVEDDLADTEEQLMDKDSLEGIINYVADAIEEMELDERTEKHEIKKAEDLLNALTKRFNENFNKAALSEGKAAETTLNEGDIDFGAGDAEDWMKAGNKIAAEIMNKYPGWIDDIYDINVEEKYITISFLIEDGDWKHDHLAFKWWMDENAEDISDCIVKYGGSKAIGEDTGGDWGTEVHTYFFIPKMEHEETEEPIETEEEIEEPIEIEETEDELMTESLKFNIAKEQIKRFNEGKMPKNWDPNIYLENLVKRNHLTEEEKSVLKETFLK